MQPLTQYILLAERHWRTWLPRLVAERQRTGRLQTARREAVARTEIEVENLRRHFTRPGLTPQPAHNRAWEVVRERYLRLPRET